MKARSVNIVYIWVTYESIELACLEKGLGPE
jgi:hypothetical protein